MIGDARHPGHDRDPATAAGATVSKSAAARELVVTTVLALTDQHPGSLDIQVVGRRPESASISACVRSPRSARAAARLDHRPCAGMGGGGDARWRMARCATAKATSRHCGSRCCRPRRPDEKIPERMSAPAVGQRGDNSRGGSSPAMADTDRASPAVNPAERLVLGGRSPLRDELLGIIGRTRVVSDRSPSGARRLLSRAAALGRESSGGLREGGRAGHRREYRGLPASDDAEDDVEKVVNRAEDPLRVFILAAPAGRRALCASEFGWVDPGEAPPA